MKKWKYLFVYLLPVSVFAAFNLEGILTFIPVIIFYGLVPLVELLLAADHRNVAEVDDDLTGNYYDWLLYLAVPIQVGFLFYFFHLMSNYNYTTVEYIGMTSSMGLMCGVFGINIAHELGHRNKWYEKLMAETLLLTSLEMHFLPYHNNGHHHNVGTRQDPATARKSEPVYAFWFRSQIASYFQAWNLEKKRLDKHGKHPFSIANKALLYTIIQVVFIAAIAYFYSYLVAGLFIWAAIGGILLLETVNYIEHYGLVRNKNASGNYERVLHQHSWNSDHQIGRAMLFELSRHSDHHYKASKKYQTLISQPDNPQMPTGYPGMMIFALIPPLWIKIMNKRIDHLG